MVSLTYLYNKEIAALKKSIVYSFLVYSTSCNNFDKLNRGAIFFRNDQIVTQKYFL